MKAKASDAVIAIHMQTIAALNLVARDALRQVVMDGRLPTLSIMRQLCKAGVLETAESGWAPAAGVAEALARVQNSTRGKANRKGAAE